MKVSDKAGSGVTLVFPDVCKIPVTGGPPPGGIALPYPGFATTALKSQKSGAGVQIKPTAPTSSAGTQPGSAGAGVASSKIKGKAEYVNYSFDVKREGKNISRNLDSTLHNDKNTPAATGVAAKKAAVRGREISQLRSALTALSTKLGSLSSRNPNDWQNVLQELAVTASALYVTLNSDDDD